jgi:thiol-disulfide isomerase/thioredoxin
MKKLSLLVVFSITLFLGFSQEIKTVRIDELKKVYTKSSDTTYVINFFASWCGPCIMEIPILNKFYDEHKNTNVQLIYVSVDNPNAVKKLQKVATKMKMLAPIYLLNESSDFSWLPNIDKRWQGSIPATMIINNKKNVKAFFETPMEKGQLEFYLSKLGL